MLQPLASLDQPLLCCNRDGKTETKTKQNIGYTLFYKNIFYKNIEAEICEILRIF